MEGIQLKCFHCEYTIVRSPNARVCQKKVIHMHKIKPVAGFRGIQHFIIDNFSLMCLAKKRIFPRTRHKRGETTTMGERFCGAVRLRAVRSGAERSERSSQRPKKRILCAGPMEARGSEGESVFPGSMVPPANYIRDFT